ncbi:MAG TPA: hypothetical protein VK712_03200 [Verrucomicrobiae bacterium]|jgi:hypothetical protein|nr:hypothetical protein [Verrucomicrobiae bacterium]
MYSGSTFTSFSGRLLGAHQKIDRVARRQLEHLLPRNHFPGVHSILHFEGGNGPDAIKRKSPAKDEPWHYLQPFDLSDTQLICLIENHYHKLVIALRANDSVRAAFEAAWLAHAVVDGLTPAHHYPYEEKLVELRGGRSITERTTIGKKLIMPGRSTGHQISNNWKMWGPKGLLTTHAAFELGVAVLIAPLKLRRSWPTADKIAAFQAQSLGEWFRHLAQDIARLELYDTFYRSGWTIPLARRVRRQLAPALVQAVALVWYGAAQEAAQ